VIALSNPLPLLRQPGGEHSAIRRDWLCFCLRRAAEKSGYAHWWLTEHVIASVVCYLAETYQKKVITSKYLHTVVFSVLQAIGYGDVAMHFQILDLPLELSLSELAREAGSGYELTFFRLLKQRIEPALLNGVSNFDFHGLHPCVRHLKSAKRWSRSCSQLRNEIVEFLRAQFHCAGLKADILVTIR
jgi:hypothetical protein